MVAKDITVTKAIKAILIIRLISSFVNAEFCAIYISVSIFIPLFVFGLLNTNQFQAIFKREYRIFLKGS